MKNRVVQLKHWVPGALTLLAVVLTAIAFLYDLMHSRREVEDAAVRRATAIGNVTTPHLERHLTNGENREANDEIARMVVVPDLAGAMIFDQDNRLIHSVDFGLRQKRMGVVDGVVTGPQMDLARRTRSAQMEFSDNGSVLRAWFPVAMGLLPGEFRPSRTAMLYFEMDLASLKSAEISAMIHRSLVMGGAAFLACLAVWGYFHGAFSRRLEELVNSVECHSKGGARKRAPDDGGDELSLIGGAVNRMVDDIERQHEALRQSEERFRELAGHVNEVFWVSGPDRSRFLYLSPAFETIWGLSSHNVLNDPALFEKSVLAEDRPMIGAALAGLAGVGSYDVQYRIQTPSGEVRWIHERAFTVLDDKQGGRVIRVVGVAQDITQRRRDEETIRRMAAFPKLNPNPVFSLAADGRVIYCNDAAVTLASRLKLGGVEGLLPSDTAGILKQCIQTGKATAREDYQLGERVFNWSFHPVPGSESVQAYAVDVTDLRLLENQLRHSQKMEAIGQLAGGVAHDFNNILAAIFGNIELALQDTPRDHPAHECLAEIKLAGSRAKSLVQQILSFSRQQPQKRAVVTLGPLVEEAARFLHATFPVSIELVTFVDSASPPVLADSTQIHQLLVNLCTNAWHALEGRPGRIELRVQAVMLDEAGAERLAGLRAGNFACLSVTDNGKGMDANTLKRIFDPFFTTKPPGQGTGLGLSVVHGIVHGHDGAITVNSQPGRGSTFQVYLPAASMPAPSTPGSSTDVKRGNGEKVLFVDDEEALVALARRMLERLGYKVSAHTQAEEAIRVFTQDPEAFRYLITDLNMPGFNGLQLAGELRKLRPDLPVLLCSGHVTDELLTIVESSGINGVLHKPVTMDELAESLNRLREALKG